MKQLFFLLLSITWIGAHAQYMKKTDVTTLISTSIKPLQTTVTTQQTALNNLTAVNNSQNATITAQASRIATLEAANAELNRQVAALKQVNTQKDAYIKTLYDTILSVRYFTKQLNDSIYTVKFRESTNNAALKNLITSRSLMLDGNQFKITGGIGTINIDWLTAWIKQLIGARLLQPANPEVYLKLHQSGGSGLVNLTELEEEVKKAKNK